jgi:hypothetical protein
MEQHSLETRLNRMEREFIDYMEHGDDFFKIELWRPARNWYKKALALNIEPERVKYKIAECDRLQAYEVTIILRIAVIAAILSMACILLL